MVKDLELINTKLNKKINNIRRSKLRLKKLLNNKIIELEKQIEDLKWETSWDNIETIDTSKDTSNITDSLEQPNIPTIPIKQENPENNV